MRSLISIIILLAFIPGISVDSQNSQWSGQLSAWGMVNDTHELPLWMGGRWLPQFNYQLNPESERLWDFEASANLNGAAGAAPFDRYSGDGQIKAYRLWARYSTPQLEIRGGLQKINFGSATLLRPLMWFDQVDARDPLQLTDGVWALLGRYYFLNNANIWLWVLYGNEPPKSWETTGTALRRPEWGGRLQLPVPRGEVALSYHHRSTKAWALADSLVADATIPENRMGWDGKWDVGAGVWLESVYLWKSETTEPFGRQLMLNTGLDYTFGIGNGLTTLYEHLLFAYGTKSLDLKNALSFSALSLNYPLALADGLSATIFYNWNSQMLYNMLTWQHDFSRWSLYALAYSNPKTYQLPFQAQEQNLFAGNGVQVMLVYNY
ncbi:hypothetical protein [Geofilum rubicundum]|uniref:Uncharacterized protein n=1 Tax=Geofilum rubicundum JCM 15548 TaxID=1236989 RepID=A0A0E9LXV6_9BACT|nr:hypothetical protein [Geofilum rubicundum]GAO30138.1 hypothetical protein JCM15548_12391 [Geofilum rubicundum JCM 15548]